MAFVLALDAGTTGVRALILDDAGERHALAYRELAAEFPRPGWVEMDPQLIFTCIQDVIAESLAIAQVGAKDVAAIGIANQRSTALVWERATGRPVAPAIVWQDNRTVGRVEELVAQGRFASSMASATKLEWILDHVDGARAAAAAGRLCFGTVDTWLAAKLSHARLHVTDSSNASCTGLYDPFADRWDAGMLEALSVPIEMMPAIRPTSAVYGTTSAAVVGAEIPIAALAGDQQAAMFGELGFDRGAVKVTIGTSAMVDVNLGSAPVLSSRGAFPLVLWNVGDGCRWCLEGSVVTAGASVQWLRDGLGIVASLEESAVLAASVSDTGGVWALPALQGLGTPHMQPKARARIGGMTRSSTKAHVVRAVLEGIGFRIAEVAETLLDDSSVERPNRLRVDGGAAANDFLLQHLANATGIEVERPACVQASALGAAFLAGLAVGVWRDPEALRASWRLGGRFAPQWSDAERDRRTARWRALSLPSQIELADHGG